MKLFNPKVWSVVDIACLKWSCILSGMIAGAFFPEFTKLHVWLFAVAAILLAIKPAVSYFGTDNQGLRCKKSTLNIVGARDAPGRERKPCAASLQLSAAETRASRVK